jgi:hypothetical protein
MGDNCVCITGKIFSEVRQGRIFRASFGVVNTRGRIKTGVVLEEGDRHINYLKRYESKRLTDKKPVSRWVLTHEIRLN